MQTYTSLREISAVLFHEIKFENNIFLIDKDYSKDKEYKPSEILDINKHWSNIYDEYFLKKDSSKFRKALKKKNSDLNLSSKIVNIQKILDIITELVVNKDYMPNDTYEKVLISLSLSLKKIDSKLILDHEKPLKDQLTKINSVLGGFKSRYKILNKQEKEEIVYDLVSFYRIKSNIETVLGRNLDENVNMLQWIAYEQQYEEKIKQK